MNESVKTVGIQMSKEERAECLKTVKESLSRWKESDIINEMIDIHDVMDLDSNINPQRPEKEYVLKNKLIWEETGWFVLFKILMCYEATLECDEVTNKFKNSESTVYLEDLYERIITNEEEVSLQYAVDNYPINRQYKKL